MSNIQNKCPCCSRSLLRHIRSTGSYWYCIHCRQEMPHFSLPDSQQLDRKNKQKITLFLEKNSKKNMGNG